MKTIGIIEDDKLLNEALSIALKREKFEVICGYSFKDGEAIIARNPEILLIDIGLPDGNGIELCKKANGYSQIPVIFLTARDDEIEMVKAFDSGCDDYILKPFSTTILIKRIYAVLRRSVEEKDLFLYKELKIDFKGMQTAYRGNDIKLTGKEYQLLEFLVRHKGQVVTRDMLLQEIWDISGAFVEENTLSVTINRLRKKIEPDPAKPIFIRNVFGIGYTFGE
ncbi:MAG: response regulator transcription factor [Lachnospiraceae bacterium]